jgi:flagellar FliL protein
MGTILDDEEEVEAPPPPPPPPMSMLTFIMVVAGLTVLAAGGGYVLGWQILGGFEHTLHSKQDPAAAGGELQPLKAANLKVLSPIVANLAGVPTTWIRLESSLVFRDELPEDADALSAKISEDIVAFLRTISAEQIEGASGFQHLSEDLNDRVRVRSGGRVQELIVQGLIVE